LKRFSLRKGGSIKKAFKFSAALALVVGPLGFLLVTTSPTSAQIVNDLVTFEPIESTFKDSSDITGCPPEFVGTFSFDARLTNVSDRSLRNLLVVVETLTDENLLQNADDGPGGVGATLVVPQKDDFSDTVLSPGEFVDVPFNICLATKTPFRLTPVVAVKDCPFVLFQVGTGVAGAPGTATAAAHANAAARAGVACAKFTKPTGQHCLAVITALDPNPITLPVPAGLFTGFVSDQFLCDP
jgi:hypothetical protein